MTTVITRPGKRPPEREIVNTIDCCVAALQSLQQGSPVTDPGVWVPLARALGYLIPLVPPEGKSGT